MSRFMLSFAAALMSAVLAVPSFAAVPAKAKSQSIIGTLQKVEGQTLTIQTPKGTQTVMLMQTAQIRSGSKKLTSSDLSSRTGDRVKVRFMEKNGQKEAQSVMVTAAKPAQTASARPGTSKTSSAAKK